LRNTTWEDMRFSWRNLELNLRDLQIAWNVFLFTSLYMNLDEFRPSSLTLEKAIENARVEDLWLLSRFYSMEQRVIEAMKDFKVHELANELVNFIVDDVSRFYLRLARKRAWQEGSSLDNTVLYYSTLPCAKVLADNGLSSDTAFCRKSLSEFCSRRQTSVCFHGGFTEA